MTELNNNEQPVDRVTEDGLTTDLAPSLNQEPAGTPLEPSDQAVSSRAKLSAGAILFGSLVSLGFLAFVLLARVTVHPFDKIDRKMRVLDVWQRLRNDLPDVAHPTLLRIAFDISIILVIVGSLACVWLALMAASPAADSDQQDGQDSLPTSAEPQLLTFEH